LFPVSQPPTKNAAIVKAALLFCLTIGVTAVKVFQLTTLVFEPPVAGSKLIQ